MHESIKTPFLLFSIAIILTPYFLVKTIKSIKNIQSQTTQDFENSNKNTKQ